MSKRRHFTAGEFERAARALAHEANLQEGNMTEISGRTVFAPVRPLCNGKQTFRRRWRLWCTKWTPMPNYRAPAAGQELSLIDQKASTVERLLSGFVTIILMLVPVTGVRGTAVIDHFLR